MDTMKRAVFAASAITRYHSCRLHHWRGYLTFLFWEQ